MRFYWDNGLKTTVGTAMGFLVGGLLGIIVFGGWRFLPGLFVPFLAVGVRAMMIRRLHGTR